MRPAEFFTALIDTNGNEVVQYWYDAWGNHKVVTKSGVTITSSTNIGNLNPFRSRGYYYDVETGLYFSQTRYYDPEVGRFLNRDSVSDTQTVFSYDALGQRYLYAESKNDVMIKEELSRDVFNHITQTNITGQVSTVIPTPITTTYTT